MRNSERPTDDAPADARREASDDERLVKGFGSMAPTLARLSIIGWYVALSISGGALLGWWLDGIIGSEPLLLVIGVLLGVAVAMAGMVRMLSSLSKNNEANGSGSP